MQDLEGLAKVLKLKIQTIIPWEGLSPPPATRTSIKAAWNRISTWRRRHGREWMNENGLNRVYVLLSAGDSRGNYSALSRDCVHRVWIRCLAKDLSVNSSWETISTWKVRGEFLSENSKWNIFHASMFTCVQSFVLQRLFRRLSCNLKMILHPSRTSQVSQGGLSRRPKSRSVFVFDRVQN